MTVQPITLHIPQVLYRQIKRRAERVQHSVEDELLQVVAMAVPDLEELPRDIAETLAQLAYLDDAALQRAASTIMPPDEIGLLEELTLKQQREGLTADERQQLERLLVRYERTMLVRAQAAVLLKRRGHEVSDPDTPTVWP